MDSPVGIGPQQDGPGSDGGGRGCVQGEGGFPKHGHGAASSILSHEGEMEAARAGQAGGSGGGDVVNHEILEGSEERRVQSAAGGGSGQKGDVVLSGSPSGEGEQEGEVLSHQGRLLPLGCLHGLDGGGNEGVDHLWSVLEQGYAYSFNRCPSNSQFGKSGLAVKLPSAGSQPYTSNMLKIDPM